jgi:hypothetical protein
MGHRPWPIVHCQFFRRILATMAAGISLNFPLQPSGVVCVISSPKRTEQNRFLGIFKPILYLN